MFKKILIANRGEIAMRILRTAKEMRIKTVAVYSTADSQSLHLRFADEVVCIGPSASKDSYLNTLNILAAAEITNADAVHPGYGFLSENANFSRSCQKMGVKFIGATPENIEKMGDKASAKATMKKAGIPTIPGSDGLISSFEDAKKIAKEIGYPIMIKATAGGGGKGMRAIWKPEDLEKNWAAAVHEAKAAFGDGGMYIEKFIEEPRHIEIQIAGDKNGKAIHLSERDCSLQRRHQKLVEETPSPFMTDELRKKMGEAAIRAAEFIKYEGVGTIEFLVDKHRNFYFMEMNTRIQVEHPITEQVTDLDLIKLQIELATGASVPKNNYLPKMHSIECRINAEDVYNDFRPSPGNINDLNIPGGNGVRVDTHVYQSYKIPPFYDSMIAKLIVTAHTRQEAILKMSRALDEFHIEGIKTTIPLHKQLMHDENFIKGEYTTKFMENFEIDEKFQHDI